MHRNQWLFAGLVVLIIVSPTTMAADEPRVNWYGDVRTAWHAARRAQRPLLVFFVSDGCRFCHVMHDKTFSDRQVSEDLKESFVVAEINVQEQPDIAKRYAVAALPTTLIFSVEGNVIHAVTGYTEAQEFRRHLQAARTIHPAKHAAEDPKPGQFSSAAR